VQLRLGAAMRTVQLWVNGQPLGEHVGDYLPVALDITEHIRPGGENCVALRLDNRDNADLGPKPIADLDFYSYGGLYRGAELRTIPPLHFTDADHPDSTAESGVLVTFPQADADEALAVVRAQFANLAAASTHVTLHAELRDADGRQLAEQTSPASGPPPIPTCTGCGYRW
jgi:beta-galactosidase